MEDKEKKLGVLFDALFEALEKDRSIDPFGKRVVKDELNDIKNMFLEGRYNDLQKTMIDLVREAYGL
jgi:hypothetical protein